MSLFLFLRLFRPCLQNAIALPPLLLPMAEMFSTLRERPFHYRGAGTGRFFSADFFSVDVKAALFFTHHLKQQFFSRRIEGQIFLNIFF